MVLTNVLRVTRHSPALLSTFVLFFGGRILFQTRLSFPEVLDGCAVQVTCWSPLRALCWTLPCSALITGVSLSRPIIVMLNSCCALCCLAVCCASPTFPRNPPRWPFCLANSDYSPHELSSTHILSAVSTSHQEVPLSADITLYHESFKLTIG